MRINKTFYSYVRNILYGLATLLLIIAVVVQYLQLIAQAAITSGEPANYSDISVGSNHTCGIKDGLAYCWGNNTNGRLGNNSTTQSLVPVAVDVTGVLSGKTVTAISAGSTHTCAVASGIAACWGSNTNGQLGNNPASPSLVPVAVDVTGVLSGKTVTAISAGVNYTCAVASGIAACWGANTDAQLGNDSYSGSLVPVEVSVRASYKAKGVTYPASALLGKTVTAIDAGSTHTCAVASDIAACWGLNQYGQLGDNSTTQAPIPVAVDVTGVLSGKTVTKVSSGNFHTCAVASDIAACWGFSGNGRLGYDAGGNQSLVPVAVDVTGVLSGKTVTAITAANNHTCAVASDIAACWGSNTDGRLGDNSGNLQSLVPVAVDVTGVLSGKTVTAISAGSTHTCAVASGIAACWGSNTNGPLGNNSIASSSVAVLVKGFGPLANAANRFFFNTNAIQPGSPLSNVDTIAPVTTGEPFRFRAGITTDTDSTLIAADNSFSLQFAQKTAATCAVQVTGFAAVTTSSTIAWNTNSNVPNGTAITSQAGDPTSLGTTNYQTYISDGSSFSNTQNILPNYNAIWDFSLKDNGGIIGVNYCLKIVYSNGNNLEQYTSYPEISIIPVELSLGFVDTVGTPVVGTPVIAFNSANSLATCQSVGSIFFPPNARLRVRQTGTTSNGWNVSIAATNGPTAVWTRDDNAAFYDYNDASGSPAGCNSGSDGDGFAGQLVLSLDGLDRLPGPGCSESVYPSNAFPDYQAGFDQATASAITLVLSSAGTIGNCYWDLSGMGAAQKIPANQPPGNYSLDFTATVVAQ